MVGFFDDHVPVKEGLVMNTLNEILRALGRIEGQLMEIRKLNL
jgi:hypothetical protein